ncbi:MAG: hypothetical protein JWN36_1507 [Microbacteriaceae bacterium]|nr:hypothetical protein [Microbacteriaceae bacterium]
MVAVMRALLRPDAPRSLEAMGLDPEVLLAVVRVEASRCEANGLSMLTHERLAELAGVSRSAVCRARLVLVDWSLESLVAVSGAPGGVHRVLQA